MKYDAFISYRHTATDMYVAKKVHKYLETFRVPGKVAKKTGKNKIKRVFRDQEELPIGSDLGNNIEYALSESDYLIVICSPRTLESEWVLKEIDTFLAMHSRDHVLAVLVEGEPDEAFPKQLLIDENGNPVEPLAADVRGLNNKEISKKLKTEGMRLVASILGCDYDDLRQRHLRRKMRIGVSIASAVAAIAIAFGIYNAYNLNRIEKAYNASLMNESKTLAGISLDVLETGDRRSAALIANEAIGDDRPFVVEAEYALSRAMGLYELTEGEKFSYDAMLEHKLTVSDMYLNSDGTRLASYDASYNLYYWDLEDETLLFEKSPQVVDGVVEPIKEIYAGDDRILVLGEYNLYCYDENGKSIYQIELGQYTTGKISDSGNVAVINSDSTLMIYDTKAGKLLTSLEEESYSEDLDASTAAISDDDRYVVVPKTENDGLAAYTSACYIVFDLTTGASSEFEAYDLGEHILDCYFAADGDFIVHTVDNGFYDANYEGDIYQHVEKYDISTNELSWTQTVKYIGNKFLDTDYRKLVSNSYTDSLNQQAGFVTVTAGRGLYSMDLATGELVAAYEHTGSIAECYLTESGATVCFADSTGNMYYYNILSNSVSDSITTEILTGSTLKDFTSHGTTLVSRGYGANTLTVSKRQGDPDGELITDFYEAGENVDAVCLSPNGTNYTVVSIASSVEDDEYVYHVYDAKTSEEIATWTPDPSENLYAYRLMYISEEKLLAYNYSGRVYIYDISTGKACHYDLNTEDSNYTLYKSGDSMLAFTNNAYYLMQLDPFEAKSCGYVFGEDTYDKTIDKAAITSDLTTVYVLGSDHQMYEYDVASQKCTPVLEDISVYSFALSYDDSKLALACADGKLRIWDLSQQAYSFEGEFYTTSNSVLEDRLLAFTEDDKYLVMQGSDYYLRILSLETMVFVKQSNEQLNNIDNMQYDPDNGLLTVSNTDALYIYDINNGFGEMQRAEHGRFYNKLDQSIVSVNSYYLYKFHMLNLRELLDKYQRYYGDDTLTKEQKMRYNIS